MAFDCIHQDGEYSNFSNMTDDIDTIRKKEQECNIWSVLRYVHRGQVQFWGHW
jgi:hypothetical protein